MSVAAVILEPKPADTTDAAAPIVNDGPKPNDPEKRARLAKKAAARKLEKKLAGAASAEEFWSKAEALAKKEGREVKAPQGEKTTPAVAVLDVAKIAKFDGPSRQLWEGVQSLLGALSTPFPAVTPFAAAMAPQEVKVIAADQTTTIVNVDPIATLAGPTAKCAAKWMPDFEGGPEAELAGAMAAVFVPVFTAMALEWVGGKIAEAEAKKSEPKAAPQIAEGKKAA